MFSLSPLRFVEEYRCDGCLSIKPHNELTLEQVPSSLLENLAPKSHKALGVEIAED